MPRTIADIIYFSNSLKENVYPDLAKIGWINDVDGAIWNDVFNYKYTYDIARITSIDTYTLPFDFTLIDKVYIEDNEVPRIDYSNRHTTGYYRNASGNLCIYPVPETDDVTAGIHVIYTSAYVRKNLTTDYVFADSPFDKMYSQYITAMIDWHNKEYEGYNNAVSMYNASFSEYINWYKKVNNNVTTDPV